MLRFLFGKLVGVSVVVVSGAKMVEVGQAGVVVGRVLVFAGIKSFTNLQIFEKYVIFLKYF